MGVSVIYKLIIAGGREFNNYELMRDSISAFMNEIDVIEFEVVSGGARGADGMGEEYADFYGHSKKTMYADWDTYGKSAGYRRNAEMANYADGCIVFWDGKSKGSKHMIDLAHAKEIDVRVVKY